VGTSATAPLARADPAEAEPILRPVFAALGHMPRWLGAAGQGSRLKLVVNAYLAALIEGVAEALALAKRLGVDPANLDATIEGWPLDAPLADAKLHKMRSGDFPPSSRSNGPSRMSISRCPLPGRTRCPRSPRCRGRGIPQSTRDMAGTTYPRLSWR